MDHLMRMAQSVALFRSVHIKTSLNILTDSGMYRVLILVFNAHGGKGIKPNQIADYFRCTRPYVSKLAKSLIRRGLLVKKSDDSDGRSYYLLCSPAGREIVEEIMEDYLTVTRKLYEGLGAEKSSQLVALLEESTAILES